jgi:beta-glucanase (GH16 family)
MRLSGMSGVRSGFYAMSGHFDMPHDAGRDKNEIHNEIDIEFVGISGRGMHRGVTICNFAMPCGWLAKLN